MSSRNYRGFTLLELVVTLAVLGVLLAWGVPAFQDAIERRQMQGAIDQVKSSFALAKSEAVKRNEQVTVSFVRTASDQWCMGFRNGDSACDCTDTDEGAVGDFCGLYDDDDNLQTTHRYLFTSDDRVEMAAAPVFDGDSAISFDPGAGVLVNFAAEGGACSNPYPTANNANGVITLASEPGNYEVRICVFPTGTTNACLTAGSNPLGGLDPCV